MHEFYPVMICGNCDELHEDCTCEDTSPKEADECEECGMTEADGDHE